MQVYRINSLRVFTGEVITKNPKDPIRPYEVMTPPPQSSGYHIWDGHKWFTRPELPTPPQVNIGMRTLMTSAQFLGLFRPEEEAAVAAAAEQNAQVQSFFDAVNAAEVIDYADPGIIEQVQMLELLGLIAAGRADEILFIANEEL